MKNNDTVYNQLSLLLDISPNSLLKGRLFFVIDFLNENGEQFDIDDILDWFNSEKKII